MEISSNNPSEEKTTVNCWFSSLKTKSSPIDNTISLMKMKTLRQDLLLLLSMALFRTWLDISISVLTTIHSIDTKFCICSRSIIDTNLNNVTKAILVPKRDMCSKCEFDFQYSEVRRRYNFMVHMSRIVISWLFCTHLCWRSLQFLQ